MSSAEVYDPFFIHRHGVEAQYVDEGAVVRCKTCSAELQVVCPKGHKDPMEPIRKSKGPVAQAPKIGERKKPKVRPVYIDRYCEVCENRLARGARHPICVACRRPVKEKFIPPPGMKRCSTCRSVKLIAEFYAKKGVPFSSCKPCFNAYIADWKRRKAVRERGGIASA